MDTNTIIEEPTNCPACGSDDLGVFTAHEEDAADLVECEKCHWIASLTQEGADSLNEADHALTEADVEFRR
jgi:uncharacterized metal-binding protein (TIGR02443 family)